MRIRIRTLVWTGVAIVVFGFGVALGEALHDTPGSGDIAPELMQTLAQTGLTTPFPEDFGGAGTIEAITYTLIAEELGFGDGGLAMNIIGSLIGPVR